MHCKKPCDIPSCLRIGWCHETSWGMLGQSCTAAFAAGFGTGFGSGPWQFHVGDSMPDSLGACHVCQDFTLWSVMKLQVPIFKTPLTHLTTSSHIHGFHLKSDLCLKKISSAQDTTLGPALPVAWALPWALLLAPATAPGNHGEPGLGTPCQVIFPNQ